MKNQIGNGNGINLRKIISVSWPFISALLVFLSLKIAERHPGFIDTYYSKGIYPVIARCFSSVSRLYPFSLWDVFWIMILWFILSGIILILLRRMKPGMFILKVLQSLAILYSLFYIVWGYNYFRPDFEKRVGWTKPGINEDLFRSVLDTLIAKSNANYIPISLSEYSKIDSLVEESYKNNFRRLGINYPNGSRRPKTMVLSSVYSKLGVSGYFGPFFNEIHVNSYVLPMDYPFLLGHEKAHQFGITSESEANLSSYIICVTSGDRRLRYSGYQTLLIYFLRDASHMKDYHDFLKKLNASVLGDIRFRQRYYQRLESTFLSDMQSKANDTYLKVNHIEKGIMNYNQVVSLVLGWYYNSKNY
jgi:hypothetical protein